MPPMWSGANKQTRFIRGLYSLVKIFNLRIDIPRYVDNPIIDQLVYMLPSLHTRRELFHDKGTTSNRGRNCCIHYMGLVFCGQNITITLHPYTHPPILDILK